MNSKKSSRWKYTLMKSHILLIYDLDETLIHASCSELDRKPDFEFNGFKVYKRPYLDEFLKECSKYYDIAIWSSATGDYVKEVVQRIVPPSINPLFIWDRSHCTRNEEERVLWENLIKIRYLKDLNKKSVEKKLKKLALQRSKILIVDDNPLQLRRNYGNAIFVREFMGDHNDEELLLLETYLKTVHDVEDIRRIEKRCWRDQVLKDRQNEV